MIFLSFYVIVLVLVFNLMYTLIFNLFSGFVYLFFKVGENSDDLYLLKIFYYILRE